MKAPLFGSALAVMVLLACGPQELLVETASEASSVTSALTTTETRISFRDDWNITLTNVLVKGQKVRVEYDADRLPGCRGDYMGKPAWSITGYYQLNGGPVGTFEAGGYSPSGGTAEPVFELTESGDLAMWFQITNRWGCTGWDSNYGNNHHFDVGVPPSVAFNADWSEVVTGMPGTTPTLEIRYALSRLPNCRATYNGYATWDIVAYYRFDGGAAQYVPVTKVEGQQRVATPVAIPIPAGAKQLELWFKNSDRAGCVAWDSDFGRNYKYMVN